MAITITKPAVNISERLSNLDGISLENFKAMNPTFSGRVGIGTAEPQRLLHLLSTSAIGIRMEGPQPRLEFIETDSTDQNYAIRLNGGDLILDTRDDAFSITGETMRLKDTGYVGIGTTAPLHGLVVSDSIGGDNAQMRRITIATDTLGVNSGFRFDSKSPNDTARAGGYYFVPGDTDADTYLGLSVDDADYQMVVTRDGNVGIGTTPGVRLHVEGATDSNVMIVNNIGTAPNYIFDVRDDGVSKLRVDPSGNLLVGTTTTATGNEGLVYFNGNSLRVTRDGNEPLNLDRLGSGGTENGSLIDLKSNGASVGSIGTTSTTMWIAGNSTEDTGIRFYTVGIAPCDSSGTYRDNSRDLGSSTVRWDDVYATNGTIQTSDRNEKQDIAELDEAERRVAVACKGLLRKFRWKSSVEENGDDARIHFGIIAQDLQAAFEDEGLDAGRYAMFTHTTWTDEETGEERSRMGVRYSELLAFIIAAI
jgi:hypothetical protein